MSGLEHVLQEVASFSEGWIGLCVRVLEGPFAGDGLWVWEDEVFPGASLVKVLVLAELLRRADSGRISLQYEILVEREDLAEGSETLDVPRHAAGISYRRLAEGMIRVSDNAATSVLISRLGMGRVDALAREIGPHRTTVRRKTMDFDR